MTDPASPIGVAVDPTPSSRPAPVTLTGRFVDIVPLTDAHAEELYPTTCGQGRDGLWTYMPDGPYADRTGFAEAIARKAASVDPLFYAIRDRANGRAVGHAGLMRIDPTNRVIEVGNILFGTALQRTPGATESMALLAAYVFDTLGYRRYEWKCNALNAPSKRAAERLGFTFEGTFRQHMIVKGRNRDTAWFSMLDTEWPACRAAFARWLSPENIGPDGQQRQSLVAMRNGSALD